MNELTPEQCRQLLSETMVGHMGVLSEGEPYVSPISYVLLQGSICIRTGPGRRIDAIREHPRVCIEVSRTEPGSGAWESVIAWGDAHLVEDDRRAQEIIAAILAKYREVMGSPLSPGSSMPEAAVLIEVPIEDLSGRESGSLFSVRTRPGRL